MKTNYCYSNCWMCGEEFGDDRTIHNRTIHHAIPKKFNPKQNFEIPVCFKCHTIIHKEDTKINAIRTKIAGLEKYVAELKLMVEK